MMLGMSESAVSACPSCGHIPLVEEAHVGFEIHCANCYTGEVSLAAWGRTRESAIEDWQENIDIYQDNRSARG
jgi:hypothetical protein